MPIELAAADSLIFSLVLPGDVDQRIDVRVVDHVRAHRMLPSEVQREQRRIYDIPWQFDAGGLQLPLRG